jgi:hypothetical protein
MVEWFNNLSEAWQTTIFGAVIAVALAVIGGLFKLVKWLWPQKDRTTNEKPDIDIPYLPTY